MHGNDSKGVKSIALHLPDGGTIRYEASKEHVAFKGERKCYVHETGIDGSTCSCPESMGINSCCANTDET